MPKREIMVADGRGGWKKRSVDVRKRGVLESEDTYERNIAIDLSRMFGHEGIGWTVERGTRAAAKDFAALMSVSRGARVGSVRELISFLNQPPTSSGRRPHHNKYERFSKHR